MVWNFHVLLSIYIYLICDLFMSGLSFSTFRLSNLLVDTLPVGAVPYTATFTSQLVPVLNISFTVELLTGPETEVVMLVWHVD